MSETEIVPESRVGEDKPDQRRRGPKKGGLYSEIQDLKFRLQEQQSTLEVIKNLLLASSEQQDEPPPQRSNNNINNGFGNYRNNPRTGYYGRSASQRQY